MKAWALKRKLAGIGFFAVAALIIGGAIIIYIIPDPSCSDGKLNGDELGIDCGGSCSKQCIGELPRDPITLWSRAFLVRDGVYDVGAVVENANLKAGTKAFFYKFKVYDKNGVLLADRAGKSFLYPGGRAFIYEPTLAVGPDIPKRVDFEFAKPEWERFAQDDSRDIEVKSKKFENFQHPLVRAVLANRSLFEVTNLEVSVLLENSSGNVYAVSRSIVESVGGKDEREVLFTWPTAAFDEPKVITVYIRKIPGE